MYVRYFPQSDFSIFFSVIESASLKIANSQCFFNNKSNSFYVVTSFQSSLRLLSVVLYEALTTMNA